MKKLFWQLVRFGIVGGGNTGLDVLIYVGLTRGVNWLGEHYLVAAVISFLISGVNGFIWNKHWTFKDKLKFTHGQLIRFYISAGVALSINQSLLWYFVSNELIHDVMAKVAAGVSAGGVNFLLQKFWTFPRPEDLYNEDADFGTVETEAKNTYTTEE